MPETDLKGKHLISFEDWTLSEIDYLLNESTNLKRSWQKGEIIEPLKQKTLFMIFFEQSTRTRNSLEAAMTRLGGHAHDLTQEKMQISHGETPRDTAQVLSRMGECIAIRNCFNRMGNAYLNRIAQYADIPLISMQDDVYHPLQVIADYQTIEEYFGKKPRGLKVALLWTYATSHAKPLSVPQSQALFFPRFGLEVSVGFPKEFPLQKNIVRKAQQNAEEAGIRITFTNDPEKAVQDADIVIPKNWGGFGYFEEGDQDEKETTRQMQANLAKHKDWICDRKLFSLAKKDACIMHALPADRGKEITDELLDSSHSIIYDEAENRIHTARALLKLVMAGM